MTLAKKMEDSGAKINTLGALTTKTGFGFTSKRIFDQGKWLISHKEKLGLALPSVQVMDWTPSKTTLVMNTYHGSAFSNQILTGSIEAEQAVAILIEASSYLRENIHSQKGNVSTGDSWEFVFDKTKRRLESIPPEYSPVFNELLHSNNLRINGKIVPSLCNLMNTLAANCTKYYQSQEEFCVVHGDFHTGNILCNEGSFILIDPRGSFELYGQHFDPAYDIGKMLHDLAVGYSMIKDESFELIDNIEALEFRFNNTSQINSFSQLFHAYREHLIRSKRYSSNQIVRGFIYAGLLTAGAIPFHMRNHKRALAMGIASLLYLHELPKNLSRIIDIDETVSIPIYMDLSI